MILSNLEIHKALDEGRIVIEPQPTPRKKGIGVKYCPYDTHTVDLRLGNEITIPKAGAYAYDFMAAGNIADHIAKNSEKHTLANNRPYRLEKG